jgi:hypothetical protein
MQWNSSPAVQVARDAAAKFSELAAGSLVPTDRCIIIYTLADGRIGLVSYGSTQALCAEARRIGEQCYDLVRDVLGGAGVNHGI